MAVDIALNVKLDALRRQLADVPGITRKEMASAVSAAGREWRRLPREVERATRDAARLSEQRIQKIRQVSAAALGDVVNDVGDVAELVGTLGPASLAVGGALATVGAGLLAIGAAAYIIDGTVRSMIAFGDAVADASDRLAEFDGALGLTDVEVSGLADEADRWRSIQEALGTTLDDTVAILGARFLPTMNDFGVVVVAGGLALRDLTRFSLAYLQVIDGIVERIPLATAAANQLTGGIYGQVKSIVASTQAILESDGVVGSYVEQAHALIMAQTALRDGEVKHTRAIRKKTDAMREANEQAEVANRLAEIGIRTARQEAELDELLNEQIATNSAKIAEIQDAQADRAQENEDRQRKAAAASALSIAGSAVQTFDAALSAIQPRSEAAARRIANLRKATAIAGIAVNTASAVTAQLAATPLPVGAPFVAAVYGIGAAQAAIAAATPSFHRGGVVGQGAPDERTARLQTGERILTRTERRQMERPAPVIVQMRYEHRGFGEFFDDFDRRRGGKNPRDSRKWAGR